MTFRTARGTRDFLPEEMIKRQFVLDKMRKIAELCGFDTIETPAFEDWALLSAKSSGGEAIKEEVYYFKDKSNRELGLRFDFTVPLARFVANNPQLPKPFKRYQTGYVWRYDRPGAGRYREFRQFDMDIIGSSDIQSEAELLLTCCRIFKEFGIEDFIIRVSDRRLIEGLVLDIGIDASKVSDIFRSIDKLEKIGKEGVKEELSKKGFESREINKIIDIISSDISKIKSKSVENIIRDLIKLEELMDDYRDNIKIDLSLVRGLDYYTGIVFEIGTKDGKLSLAGGGRYDKLVELYGGKPTPAMGIALGFARIVELMESRGLLDLPKTNTKIFVISIGDSLKVSRQITNLTNKLRDSGISTEYDIMNRSLTKQLDYVNSKGIPYAIIVGEKELSKNMIKFKNMKSGEEKDISIARFEQDIGEMMK
ncbi:MAG: histidine--tRNA ligase [Candidatus Aenigmarchaeota archaeon]|nr:histidine--tRNA ligase [Candidatus Aenigmarchaeota archaeon]